MTSKNLVHFILTTLLFGVTACGSITGDEPLDDEYTELCSNAASASVEDDFYKSDYPYIASGSIINFDPDLRFIAIGEHAGASTGPPAQPLGGMTFFFDEPRDIQFVSLPNSPDKCAANIVSATLSTTDRRIGTAEELNAKLYKLAGGSAKTCDRTLDDGEVVYLLSDHVEFFYVSSGRARGWFCANMQQVSPVSGEPFLVSGEFSFRN